MSEPCKLPDGRELFRLDFIVRLTEDHPMHGGRVESGKLIIWVYDHSIEHAASRAFYLLRVMPFQATSSEVEGDYAITPDNAAYEILADMVERVGHAAHFEPDEKPPNERGMIAGENRGLTK